MSEQQLEEEAVTVLVAMRQRDRPQWLKRRRVSEAESLRDTWERYRMDQIK